MTRLHKGTGTGTGTSTLLLLVSLLSSPQAGDAFRAGGVGSRTHIAHPTGFRPTGGWALPVIKSEEMDFEIDVGRGGVRLAQESAVKMVGAVQHRPGSATPQLQNLIRYTDVTLLDETSVRDQLRAMGATIVCTGQGEGDV
jgi:hypothetical protein